MSSKDFRMTALTDALGGEIRISDTLRTTHDAARLIAIIRIVAPWLSSHREMVAEDIGVLPASPRTYADELVEAGLALRARALTDPRP